MTEHLYHVTFYNHLGDIAQDGLQPGRGRGIGGSFYDPHREGAIFLTSEDGVYFWGSRAEEWAQHNSDNIYEDGLAPVLLRVSANYENNCEYDELGSDDANADAYKCRTKIPPEDIEVWVGTSDKGEWLWIDDWNEIPYDDAFEEDSDDDETWMVLKESYGSPSPLMPDLSMFGDVKTKVLKARLLR